MKKPIVNNSSFTINIARCKLSRTLGHIIRSPRMVERLSNSVFEPMGTDCCGAA
jgi:hypothetical protein